MATIIVEQAVVNGELVTLHRDSEVDKQARRFMVSDSIQRSIGFRLDSSHVSTIGQNKHTGNMSKGKAAQNRKTPGLSSNGRISRQIKRGQSEAVRDLG